MSRHNWHNLLDCVDTAYYSDENHKAVIEVMQRDHTGATSVTLFVDGSHYTDGEKLSIALKQHGVSDDGWTTKPEP